MVDVFKCRQCGETDGAKFYGKQRGECKKCKNECSKEWNRQHPEHVKAYLKEWRKRNYASYRAYQRRYLKQYCRELRLRVLGYYGGGKLACAQCGFDDERALSIDHINNNGAEHRREIGRVSIYRWLKARNYPDGYQTLCMNCQFIKRRAATDNP